jgi:hypothetical protein
MSEILRLASTYGEVSLQVTVALGSADTGGASTIESPCVVMATYPAASR